MKESRLESLGTEVYVKRLNGEGTEPGVHEIISALPFQLRGIRSMNIPGEPAARKGTQLRFLPASRLLEVPLDELHNVNEFKLS